MASPISAPSTRPICAGGEQGSAQGERQRRRAAESSSGARPSCAKLTRGQGRWQFVKARRGVHRLARRIHVGHRFQREDLLAADGALGGHALEPAPPGGKPVANGDDVQRHEADIVPIACHPRLRIAEADPEQHRRPPSGRPRADRPRADRWTQPEISLASRALWPEPSRALRREPRRPRRRRLLRPWSAARRSRSRSPDRSRPARPRSLAGRATARYH